MRGRSLAWCMKVLRDCLCVYYVVCVSPPPTPVRVCGSLVLSGTSRGMLCTVQFSFLGAGGVERSEAHAHGSARLITEMDPHFLSALTLTVVPGSSLARAEASGRFTLPEVPQLLHELRIMVDESRPTNALFRTNHASNYLPLGGRLPNDRQRIVETLDLALSGAIPLRPEWSRGL